MTRNRSDWEAAAPTSVSAVQREGLRAAINLLEQLEESEPVNDEYAEAG